MSTRLSVWLNQLKQIGARRESGQIIVLFAVFVIVLMVLAGSAYDYASIVTDDARLQNAVDAAALAGSNTLSQNAGLPVGTPVAMAQATVAAYLALNGVATTTPGTIATMTFPTSTPVGVSPSSPIIENLSLQVTRNHPNAFWPLVGLNSVTLHDQGSAHAARGMVDVMLSLDTTYSEVYTGSFTSIQTAVASFINTMNPTTADPRGPQIGIARWGGIMCDYNPAGDGGGGPGPYDTGCQDDMNVLTPLTQDKPTLMAVANGPSGSPCPVGAAANGGCPLTHLYYQAGNTSGCPGTCTPSRYTSTSGSFGMYDPAATGTKLPNAMSVVGVSPTNPYPILAAPYAWSTANGGRNNVAAGTNARKVMIMMTDGNDELWPNPGASGQTVAGYDSQVVLEATSLKKGADGIAGTSDDVEIYVVAYFCTPYTPGATSVPAKWCQSAIADTTAPHPCPGPTWPPAGVTPSNIDTLLWTISSSTPGTCDHYYPLGKTEGLLPQLFQALAGRISRGQLTS